jgi:TetR/AcrR family transcriptional regulator
VASPRSATVPLTRPRRGEVTAARILDAAEELFAERGYHGTSLRDVADRVGLRIPSLYNHFSSKEALYAAVLARGIGPVVELLTELAQAPESERNDPLRVVEPVMKLLAERPHLPRLLLHETLSGGERLTPMLREWMAPTFARAQALVEGRGSQDTMPPERAALLVLAMYHVVLGFFASAPLYRAVTGTDLLSPSMFARQIELLRQMSEALLPGPRPADAAQGDRP